MEKVIELKNVDNHFGTNHVLNKISLTINSGQLVGLIGPSGAGKSTLIAAMLGMLRGENEYSYAPYEAEQALEFLTGLRELSSYIIIDCSSYISNDILSAVSLMEADAVLQIVNCDLKSISYLASQLPLLQEPKWRIERHLKTINNIKGQEAINHMEQVLGSVSFQIPHSREVETQYLEGDMLAELGLKESRAFRKEIEKISKEVFGV